MRRRSQKGRGFIAPSSLVTAPCSARTPGWHPERRARTRRPDCAAAAPSHWHAYGQSDPRWSSRCEEPLTACSSRASTTAARHALRATSSSASRSSDCVIAGHAAASLIFDRACSAWLRACATMEPSSAISLGTVTCDGKRVSAHVSMSRTLNGRCAGSLARRSPKRRVSSLSVFISVLYPTGGPPLARRTSSSSQHAKNKSPDWQCQSGPDGDLPKGCQLANPSEMERSAPPEHESTRCTGHMGARPRPRYAVAFGLDQLLVHRGADCTLNFLCQRNFREDSHARRSRIDLGRAPSVGSNIAARVPFEG